jgi:hypothetical protein
MDFSPSLSPRLESGFFAPLAFAGPGTAVGERLAALVVERRSLSPRIEAARQTVASTLETGGEFWAAAYQSEPATLALHLADAGWLKRMVISAVAASALREEARLSCQTIAEEELTLTGLRPANPGRIFALLKQELVSTDRSPSDRRRALEHQAGQLARALMQNPADLVFRLSGQGAPSLEAVIAVDRNNGHIRVLAHYCA